MMFALKKHCSVAVLGVSLLISCGPGVQEGPVPAASDTSAHMGSISTDSSDTDTVGTDTVDSDTVDSDTVDSDTVDSDTVDSSVLDSDTADAGVTDSDPLSWCPSETIEGYPVLTADQLLEGGELVAIGNSCVLAARKEIQGYTAVTAFISGATPDKIVSVFESTVPFKPKAVSCRLDPVALVYIAYVAVSDETTGVLYELVSDVGALAEIFRGPSLNGVQQMMRTEAPAMDEICVYGNGVYCAPRGSDWTAWREEIPSGNGAMINDLALLDCEEGWCPAVVGQAGYLSMKQQGAWASISLNTKADLLTISQNHEKFIAGGAGGTFLYGDAANVAEFTILDGKDIVSVSWNGSPYLKGATADGTVFEGEIRNGNVAVCPDATRVAGTLLDGLFFDCIDSQNYLVAGPDALLGQYWCEVLVII